MVKNPATLAMSTSLIGSFIGLVIGVVLNVSLNRYIYNMEVSKCECTAGWKRDALKTMTFVNIGIAMAQFGIMWTTNQRLGGPLMLPITIYGLFFLWMVFTYLSELRSTCACSENFTREALYYIYLFEIFVFVSMFALTVLSLVILFIVLVLGKF